MNILFTGIGGPTPIGLAKSTRMTWPNYRCIGVDASLWAPSLYQSDVFNATYRIPSASDPDYWTAIERIIQKEKIDFAFVVPETEVLVWTERAAKSTLPCKVHIPSASLAAFCFDKFSVAQFLYEKGLTPKTVLIDTQEALTTEHSKIDFPYWIRVKSGAGALGALKISSRKDLITWLALHSNRNDFIASEFLPGKNYACKILYHHGELIQSASAERIDYLLSAAAPSGISGMCARGKLLNRPDLVLASRTALESIAKHLDQQLHGIFTVDFKENNSGKPLITEINIRHVSFTHAFALGGINFAETTIRLLLHSESDFSISNTFTSESYFARGVDAPLRLLDPANLNEAANMK